MNTTSKILLYSEAHRVRNLDGHTLDLILKAEDIDVDTATIRECKEAVIKYQYLNDDDSWEWQTDQKRVIEAIRARMPT